MLTNLGLVATAKFPVIVVPEYGAFKSVYPAPLAIKPTPEPPISKPPLTIKFCENRELEKKKIILFRNYSKRYVLFEGTDLDIQSALIEAGSATNVPLHGPGLADPWADSALEMTRHGRQVPR